MPKDDFARLERRFEERPLFGPQRTRRPLTRLMGATLMLAVLAGLAALQGPAAVDLLSRMVDARAQPAAAPDEAAIPVRLTPPPQPEAQGPDHDL